MLTSPLFAYCTSGTSMGTVSAVLLGRATERRGTRVIGRDSRRFGHCASQARLISALEVRRLHSAAYPGPETVRRLRGLTFSAAEQPKMGREGFEPSTLGLRVPC